MAVAVMLSLGAWWSTSQGTLPVPDAPVAMPSPRVELVVTVHVAGAVNRPGVVRLPAGSRVVDAVEAAGGATRSAVLAGVNLAAEISDGAQIVVPGEQHSVPGSGDGFLVVNTARPGDLETLPGVGPVLAARIVAHRETHGAFSTPEDLLDVPGIGEATLARLRPLIRIP